MSAPAADRFEALATEWENFADRLRRDLGRMPAEDRLAAEERAQVWEARAQVWVAAARDLRRVLAGAEPIECANCKRARLGAEILAKQADSVRAAVEGALAVVLARSGDALAAAYGGDTRRAAVAGLIRAGNLALELARALACVAGTCRREVKP